MSSLLSILVLMIISFLVGNHYGYKRVMDDIREVIDRVEKQYTKKL
jgi:hypothetical protein